LGRTCFAGSSTWPLSRQPESAERYRERKCSSGDKTDRHDAWSQADALALVEERSVQVNQLEQAPHEYDPTALEAFDHWPLVVAWSFVETFPSAER
jgi:hypothetical protein